MNLKFSLTQSLLLYNNLETKSTNEIYEFVNSQINKMPDYLFFGVKSLCVIFEILVFISFFKRFHNLTDKKKLIIISFIKTKKILFFDLLIRLFESNTIVKYYEINNE